MTIALSPATPVRLLCQQQLTRKPVLFCFQDKFPTSGNVVCWSASANYSSLWVGARRLQPLVKPSWGKRSGIVRCATIEEIEAEKSSIEKDVKERMEKTVETVRSNFNSIRTGRASPAMLDKIEVDYYGTPVSLKSIAQISTPDASSILVQPYDKSSLKAIEKAIVSSDVGMTPNNDGEVIRLAVPQLTSDRRKRTDKLDFLSQVHVTFSYSSYVTGIIQNCF
ncbi:ribosome-recycling factor, chloroplastic isoform X2 [Solanum pennellii]|uniref:Ribosome-recycling factor, chloroplastic n=1 Tax=Solanum pennellii TaxID=28526 RepID=A0ABM1HNV1_SOLPN|nr:ribosome-recycling factor, chloroplastic isoform X2 [Solanum pennellii]